MIKDFPTEHQPQTLNLCKQIAPTLADEIFFNFFFCSDYFAVSMMIITIAVIKWVWLINNNFPLIVFDRGGNG